MPPPRIEAGKLRHRVEIVAPAPTQDSFGGTSPLDEKSFGTVWASVEALSGRELFNAQQVVANVTHRVTMRWLDGVKARMNVWFNGRQFQIQAVENPDERRHLLYLLCIERDDAAREPAGVPGS